MSNQRNGRNERNGLFQIQGLKCLNPFISHRTFSLKQYQNDHMSLWIKTIIPISLSLSLTQRNQIQTHSSSHIYLERPTIESNLVYNKVYPDEKINK